MTLKILCWASAAVAIVTTGVRAQDQWPRATEPPARVEASMSCIACHAISDQQTKLVYSRDRRGGARFDELLRPDFIRSDLRLFVESVQLDESQRTIVRALLEDYLQQFYRTAEELRNAVRHMEARNRAAVLSDGLFLNQLEDSEIDQADRLHNGLIREMLQELREAEKHPEHNPEGVARIARAFWRDKQAMQVQFVGDLTLILTEDQTEVLDLALAIVRCTNDLPRGQYSAESLNIALLLDALPEPASIDIQTVGHLEQAWFVDAASALRHRNTVLIEHEIASLALIEEDDIGQRIRMARRESDSRVSVRDINRSGVQQIAGAMHPNEADVLQSESLHRSFPRVFNPTTPTRVLASALDLDELEPQTIEALRSIQEGYLRQIDALNKRIVLSTLAEEPQEEVERLKFLQSKQILDPERMASDMLLLPTMERTSGLYEQRRAIGLRTLEQLSAILTPSQVELLMRDR